MKKNKLRSTCLPFLRGLCATVFALASASSVLAQDWRIEPALRVGAEFDDNSTLSPRTDEEADLSGLLFDIRADFTYASPTTSLLLQPRALIRNYDDTEFDSDDFFVRTNYRRRVNLSTMGIRIDFENQSVRTAERADSDLEIEDPDDILNDDTGRTFRTGKREKWRALPYWDLQLSSVSSIGAKIDYRDTRYDDVFAGLLNDYSDARLDLYYRRSISSVTAGLISVTGRRYDSENLSNTTDGYGIVAGLEHTLSEKTRVKATIGIEDTDGIDSSANAEPVGSVALIRKLETIRLLAQYRRSVSGGGAGLSVRDSLNLNFRRRLNERISAGLGVRAYRTKGASSSSSVLGRDYIQLRSSLVWYLSKSFVIEADYRYTVLDRGDALEGSANSNQVNLWFVYQPNTIPKL